MPKIGSPPPVKTITGTQPAVARPAATPESARPASGTWGGGSTTAAERREKATSVNTKEVPLTDAQKAGVVQKKATCPFVGTAVQTGALPVRNNGEAPLASIDDVVKLGNTGKGSDLGNLLKVFATGNHGLMAGASGKLDTPVPMGTFSLDLAGSQGSHAGHSGILLGDPSKPNAGRMSEADLNRLLSFAKDGHISRSDLGKFIGQNIARDPNAHATGLSTGVKIARDLAELGGSVAKTLADKAKGTSTPEQERAAFAKLTKILGEDHVIGSSGEFGLMAALLANSPNTKQVKTALGSEPAYSVAELKMMFKDKQFPPGWETWKKSSADWITSTTALTLSAEKELIKQKVSG